MMPTHVSWHPRFADVIDLDLPVDRFLTGFDFTEGPVWDAPTARLIFSDIAGDTLYACQDDGDVRVVRKPSNMTNGNALDVQGRLLSCEHATSRVIRREADGDILCLASHWQGRALNSPNDVIVDRAGQIYFTDPTYGRMPFYGVPREPEIDFRGVYRLEPATGALELLADDFDQPNGLCLSRDESRLFVSDTRRGHVRVFDLAPDGRARDGGIWVETRGDWPGTPDGLKFDSRENLFSCGPGGIQVFAPEGTPLGVIRTPEEAANFAWGGADLRTLFITAQTSVYRVRVRVPGREFS